MAHRRNITNYNLTQNKPLNNIENNFSKIEKPISSVYNIYFNKEKLSNSFNKGPVYNSSSNRHKKIPIYNSLFYSPSKTDKKMSYKILFPKFKNYNSQRDSCSIEYASSFIKNSKKEINNTIHPDIYIKKNTISSSRKRCFSEKNLKLKNKIADSYLILTPTKIANNRSSDKIKDDSNKNQNIININLYNEKNNYIANNIINQIYMNKNKNKNNNNSIYAKKNNSINSSITNNESVILTERKPIPRRSNYSFYYCSKNSKKNLNKGCVIKQKNSKKKINYLPKVQKRPSRQYNSDYDYNESSIIKIQSVVRGYLLNKKLDKYLRHYMHINGAIKILEKIINKKVFKVLKENKKKKNYKFKNIYYTNKRQNSFNNSNSNRNNSNRYNTNRIEINRNNSKRNNSNRNNSNLNNSNRNNLNRNNSNSNNLNRNNSNSNNSNRNNSNSNNSNRNNSNSNNSNRNNSIRINSNLNNSFRKNSNKNNCQKNIELQCKINELITEKIELQNNYENLKEFIRKYKELEKQNESLKKEIEKLKQNNKELTTQLNNNKKNIPNNYNNFNINRNKYKRYVIQRQNDIKIISPKRVDLIYKKYNPNKEIQKCEKNDFFTLGTDGKDNEEIYLEKESLKVNKLKYLIKKKENNIKYKLFKSFVKFYYNGICNQNIMNFPINIANNRSPKNTINRRYNTGENNNLFNCVSIKTLSDNSSVFTEKRCHNNLDAIDNKMVTSNFFFEEDNKKK